MSTDPTHAPFVIRERVRWSDVDPARIIRWDAYTRFIELGESELFRSVGIDYAHIFDRFRMGLPRRVLHMEYVSAPVLDEELEVVMYISDVRTSSLTLSFDVFGVGGALRMFGYVVLVCTPVHPEVLSKRPLPAEFLTLLDRYRVTVEEARRGRVSSYT